MNCGRIEIIIRYKVICYKANKSSDGIHRVNQIYTSQCASGPNEFYYEESLNQYRELKSCHKNQLPTGCLGDFIIFVIDLKLFKHIASDGIIIVDDSK